MLKFYKEPIIQKIEDPKITQKGIQLFIKREDLIHPFVSGNKWRKLKYNLLYAEKQGFETLLTFGGAYSNHIYATAAAANETGLNSIGIIRGEELEDKPLNKTLSFSHEQGMRLKFIDRSCYKEKTSTEFIKSLKSEFGEFYLLPEGGTNALAIKGCAEILNEQTKEYDYITSSIGTGGTVSGLIVAAEPHQKVIGFSSLKGGFLQDEVKELIEGYSGGSFTNWSINDDYHFGGYAKQNEELNTFMGQFELKYVIPLDPVYTGKMMYGIFDMIDKDYFTSGSKILAIHTGGLQGRVIQ